MKYMSNNKNMVSGSYLQAHLNSSLNKALLRNQRKVCVDIDKTK